MNTRNLQHFPQIPALGAVRPCRQRLRTLAIKALATFSCLWLFAGLSTVFAANLLTNPGFEDGQTGWSNPNLVRGGVSEVVTDPAVAHSGSNYISCNNPSGWSSAEQGDARGGWPTGVSLPVSPASYYTLKAWVKVPGASVTPQAITLRYRFEPSTDRVDVGTQIISTEEWTLLESPLIQPKAGDTYMGYWEVHSVNNGVAFYADDCVLEESAPLTLQGRVVDESATGVDGATVLATSAGFAPPATTTSGGGYYTLSVPVGTYTVSAAAPGMKGSTSVEVATSPTSASDIVLTVDPNYDTDLLFSAHSSDYVSGGNWPMIYPAGSNLTRIGAPGTMTVNGESWVSNKRSTQDGFNAWNLAGQVIPIDGITFVAAVRPLRNGLSEPWNAVLEMQLQNLILGVRNDNGRVQIVRNGNWNQSDTGYDVPNGQITILSLVLTSDGAYTLYANGELKATGAAIGAGTYSNLQTWNNWNDIRIGRGVDGWSAFNGNIGDVYFYKKVIDDTKRTELEAALAAKYGTAEIFTITASAGTGGTISPVDAVSVPANADQSFVITPSQYFDLTSVLVDGATEVVAAGGSAQTYPYTNVTADSSIAASFVAWAPTYITGTITEGASGVAGIPVTASGNRGPFTATTAADGKYSIQVKPGETYTVTAAKVGYEIAPTSYSAGPGDLTGKDFSATTVEILPQSLFLNRSANWRNGGYTLGTKFTTGPNPVSVSKLGFVDQDLNGLSASHQVAIWDSTNTQVAFGTVPSGTDGELLGEYRYVAIEPMTLLPNTTYTLSASEVGDFSTEQAPNPGFSTPYFDGFVAVAAMATDPDGTGNVKAPGWIWSNGNVYTGVNMIGITVTVEAATISGTVTDAGAGVANVTVTTSPGGLATTTDSNGSYEISSVLSGVAYTLSASNLPAGKMLDTAPDAFTATAGANSGKDFVLKDNPDYDPDLLFSMTVDGLAGLNAGDATGDRATVYPAGGTMVKLGAPKVIAVDGLNWQQNTYSAADGYRFVAPDVPGGVYNAPIPANGVSIVAVVQPTYIGVGGEPRGEIVDLFYNELFLAVSHNPNNEGEVIVDWRGYNARNTGYKIPDGQKTILGLVVQPNGDMKLFANGELKWTASSGVDYTSLVPLSWAKTITIGRNDFDGWSIFSGNIGDVSLFKTAITDERRIVLENDAAAKFGITLPVFHTITASAGPNGTISPDGASQVAENSSPTFNFYPTAGYVNVVTVDGIDEPGHPTSYTFNTVTGPRTISVTFTVEPGPSNDNFADALALPDSSGTQTGTGTLFATKETDEPAFLYSGSDFEKSVWFKWTAPSSGDFTIDTFGSLNLAGQNWDSVIYIYDGATLGTLNQLAAVDNGQQETATQAVTAGTTYYIRLAWGGGPSGNAATQRDTTDVHLNWSFVGSGTNGYDSWASANVGDQTIEMDYDNDGVDNGVEYFMGAAAGFTVNPKVVTVAGVRTVTWPHLNSDGITYSVKTSENLKDWTDVTGSAVDNGGTLVYTLPTIGSGRLFVRLEVNKVP